MPYLFTFQANILVKDVEKSYISESFDYNFVSSKHHFKKTFYVIFVISTFAFFNSTFVL